MKVKKMGGEGGGDAIIMISKTATIEELKTKVKERYVYSAISAIS